MSENIGERGKVSVLEKPQIEIVPLTRGQETKSHTRVFVGRGGPVGLRDMAYPKQVSRFTIGEHIASGGEGVVHKAHAGDTEAAVKFSKDSRTQDNDQTGVTLRKKRRFSFRGRKDVVRVILPKKRSGGAVLSEADILRRVGKRNRNILSVYTSDRTPKHRKGEIPGVSYMATELVQEGSLNDTLRSGQHFSVYESVGIADQVASALEATHAQGIVHGDVKPANVLVRSAQGRIPDVVLSDFGVASPPRTLRGDELSAPYASPEQIAQRVSYSSDIYSLGLLLYELETGERFFTFPPEVIVAYKRVGLNMDQEEYYSFVRSKLQKLEGTSPETVRLLEGMLQLSESDRPQLKTVRNQLMQISKKYAQNDRKYSPAI